MVRLEEHSAQNHRDLNETLSCVPLCDPQCTSRHLGPSGRDFFLGNVGLVIDQIRLEGTFSNFEMGPRISSFRDCLCESVKEGIKAQ